MLNTDTCRDRDRVLLQSFYESFAVQTCSFCYRTYLPITFVIPRCLIRLFWSLQIPLQATFLSCLPVVTDFAVNVFVPALPACPACRPPFLLLMLGDAYTFVGARCYHLPCLPACWDHHRGIPPCLPLPLPLRCHRARYRATCRCTYALPLPLPGTFVHLLVHLLLKYIFWYI